MNRAKRETIGISVDNIIRPTCRCEIPIQNDPVEVENMTKNANRAVIKYEFNR